MNICHLYCEKTESLLAKNILASFEDSLSIDISKIDKVEEFSVYLIEANKVDKIISEKIRKIFEHKASALIYFLVSNEYNLMLFQLAFLLKAKTVINANQDANKVIAKIESDFILHQEEYIKNLLGKTIINTQIFMLFSNKKLFFSSKKLLEEFECVDFVQVEQKVCSKFNLEKLLSEESTLEVLLNNNSKKKVSFHIKSTNLNKENEKLISLEACMRKNFNNNDLSFVSNRISFIDFLNHKIKDKKNNVNYIFSIITLKIRNLSKLRLDSDVVKIENFLKDFLILAEKNLDKKIILAQYDSDLYVAIFENIEFDNLKDKAKNFLNEISEFLNELGFTPFVDLVVFNVKDMDLDNILTMINDISDETLSKTRDTNDNLFYVGSSNDNLSESENIQQVLNSAFVNDIDIKLLNIYKGVVINTSSKIVKIIADSIYITFQSLQGIVMMSEKETVLQSSSFAKDIRGTVKYVNMDKKIAILEDFSFLNGNANSRKNNRVTCATRTPVVASSSSGTLSGEILDISLTSIAIRAKYAKIIANMKSCDVKLSFVLPSRSHTDEQVKLILDAKVLFINCKNGFCTIVCDLYEDESDEAILMEYVYDRQKEIILEIKKMTKRI